MKAREIVYLWVTRVLSRLLHNTCFIKTLSIFSFPSSRANLLEPGMRSWLRSYGQWIAITVVVMLLGVNLVWSWARGALWRNTSDSVYSMLEDWPNLLNYGVLGPIYVTLCICFLVHIRGLRASLAANGLFETLGVQASVMGQRPVKWVLAVAAVLVAALGVTARYRVEVPKLGKPFWFEALGAGGGTDFSPHAIYYYSTNFILMVVVFAMIAAHFEVLVVTGMVGSRLQKLGNQAGSVGARLEDDEDTTVMFAPLMTLYVISKYLVLMFLVNMYTWKAQQPDFVGLLDVSVIALAVLGTAVVSYPRYHVQYWLFRLRNRDRSGGAAQPYTRSYPDIRPPLIAGAASIADIFILGGATTNIVVSVLTRISFQIQ